MLSVTIVGVVVVYVKSKSRDGQIFYQGCGRMREKEGEVKGDE